MNIFIDDVIYSFLFSSFAIVIALYFFGKKFNSLNAVLFMYLGVFSFECIKWSILGFDGDFSKILGFTISTVCAYLFVRLRKA